MPFMRFLLPLVPPQMILRDAGILSLRELYVHLWASVNLHIELCACMMFTIYRLNGIVDCGDGHKHIYERAMLLVEQVRVSKGSPLVTCLLEGPSGSGKSAMAATIGINSDFPYVKIVSFMFLIVTLNSKKQLICCHLVLMFGCIWSR
jgi:hypothetical protein